MRTLAWNLLWAKDATGVTNVAAITPLEVGPLEVNAALRMDLEVRRDPTVRVVVTSKGVTLVEREESVSAKLAGVFMGEEAATAVTPQVQGMINGAIRDAHLNIRTMLTLAQERVRVLSDIRAEMQYVTLHHGEKKNKLTLDIAELVLLAGTYLCNARPLRVERVRSNEAVAYDDLGRGMGRIGYDPTDPRNWRNHPQSRGYYGFYQIIPQLRPGEKREGQR